jgi:hypothetical protein
LITILLIRSEKIFREKSKIFSPEKSIILIQDNLNHNVNPAKIKNIIRSIVPVKFKYFSRNAEIRLPVKPPVPANKI